MAEQLIFSVYVNEFLNIIYLAAFLFSNSILCGREKAMANYP